MPGVIHPPVKLQQDIQQLQHLPLVGYTSNIDTVSWYTHDLIQIMIQGSATRARAMIRPMSQRSLPVVFRRVEDPYTCWAQCAFGPQIVSLTSS
jgi:hypothetical protein